MPPAQPEPTQSGRGSRRRAGCPSCFLIQSHGERIRGNARWWCDSLVPPSLSGLLCCRASIIVYVRLSCKYFFNKYSKASVCCESRRVFLPMRRGFSVVSLLVCGAVAIHGLLPIALRQTVQLLAYPPCIIWAVHHLGCASLQLQPLLKSHPCAFPS